MSDNSMTFTEQKADGTNIEYRAAIQQEQQAEQDGRMVMYLRNGELVSRNEFMTTEHPMRSSLAKQFEAALNGDTVSNTALSRAYASSVTAYAAANYRADTVSTIRLKIVDPATQDVPISPAQWYINNSAILNWHIEMSLVLWGVTYLRKTLNPSRFPTGLEWLHPETVSHDERLFEGQGGWRIRNAKGYGQDETLGLRELVFITTFDPQGSDNGKSEYEVAMKDITTEQGMSTHAATFFINRARPDGILISKKSIPTKEKRDALIEEWKQFEGAENSHKTFITSHDFEYIPLTGDFGSLAMPELSATVQRDIAMALRVNPILIGAGLPSDPLSAQSTYRSIERAHVDSVTLPRLENLILSQLNRQWLWTDFSKKKFYTLVVDRMNTPVLSNVNNDTVTQATQLTTGAITDYNESRKLLSLPERDNYIARNPTDALALLNGGSVMIDESRSLVGLSDLMMGNGRVIKMADGTVIPASMLMKVAKANAERLINPPDPAPVGGGGFFGLSDIAEFRRMLVDDVELKLNRWAKDYFRNSPIPLPPDSTDMVQIELRDGKPTVRNIDTVEIAINLRGNAFARYITRELGRRLIEHEVMQVAWTDADTWHIPIVRFDHIQPAQAQLLINSMEIDAIKMRGHLGGYVYDETSGSIRVGVQSEDIGAFVEQITTQAHELGLSAQVIENPTLHLGTVTIVPPLVVFEGGATFAAEFDTVDIRFNGDVAHSWSLRHYTQVQAKELDIWQRKETRHKIRRSRPHARFKVNNLPNNIVNVIHWGLRLGGDAETVFNTARAMLRGAYRQDDILLDDLATPEEYEKYWANYDSLNSEVGTDWLDKYMARAWDAMRSVLQSGNTPTDADVGDALRMNHDVLVDEWVGIDPDNLGVLSKIILAGQAAGNEAVVDNMPADYRHIVRAIDGVISWNQSNEQAYDFARRYTYTLIKDIDNTTRSKIQDIIAEWVTEQGATLNDLESRLEPIFTDPSRARRIANTESIRAYSEGVKERWRTVGVSLARWMTVRDSSVCPICLGLRGVTADFDTGFEHPGGIVSNEETGAIKDGSSFKGRVYKPPAHPECRCFMKPIIPDASVLDLSDFGGNHDNGGEDAQDRDASDDKPPTDKRAAYEERQRMKLRDALSASNQELSDIREAVLNSGQMLTFQLIDLDDERENNRDDKRSLREPLIEERAQLFSDLRGLSKGRHSLEPRDDLTVAQMEDFNSKLTRMTAINDEVDNIRIEFDGRNEKLESQRRGIINTRSRIVANASGDSPAPNIRANLEKGSKAFKSKTDPRAEHLESAVDWLSDIVDGEIHNNDNTFIPKAKRGRANYDPKLRTINIDKKDTVSTIIHEIGHGLEINNPHIMARAIEFRDLRKSNDTPQTLRKLNGSRGYASHEIAYEDKWKRNYMGKIYRRADGIDFATEIISMGLEELYNNPDEFADSDPEYFNFMVGILRGLI